MALDDFDRALIAATQGGLPLVPRPYDAVGERLGVGGQQVRERLAQMLETGLIRRIGAVPNHYRLGFTANGMSVWNVDDDQVDALGERIGQLPGVSHCYRRPRHLPKASPGRSHPHRGVRVEDPRNAPSDEGDYFISFERLSKVVFRLVPRAPAPTMMATPISEAIRPYSMAVAPDSFLAKRAISFFMTVAPHVRCV